MSLEKLVHYPNGLILKLSEWFHCSQLSHLFRKQLNKILCRFAALPWIRIFEERNELLTATYEINLVDYPTVKIDSIETDYVVPTRVV
ncbi:Cyclic di-GMP phosphodiesterase response regulator RpfG OS=Lysinibacillus sphaericus OX=1421 GN=rpfG_2 PE=4 SV=1 [Lysinibacillus sphaericus]